MKLYIASGGTDKVITEQYKLIIIETVLKFSESFNYNIVNTVYNGRHFETLCIEIFGMLQSDINMLNHTLLHVTGQRAIGMSLDGQFMEIAKQ